MRNAGPDPGGDVLADEEATAGRARVGPRDFAAFYADHVHPVTGLAYALTGSWPAAEDLAQEAFVRAYRDWRRVGAFDRPDTWVRTVAVNLATSRWRRIAAEGRALTRLGNRRHRVAVDPLDEDGEAFWRAVRRLPRRQAQAAALRYAEDRSIAGIADVMGCAEGTAKAHLHAARTRLAELLDPGDPR